MNDLKKKIVAAGGLVTNDREELLLIFRKKRWDLPKGKCEDGESIEECAIREVKEETGLQNLYIKKFVGKTYHEYYEKWINQHVIKETWWFAMSASDNCELIPQIEEDIEEVIWANEATLNQCLQNTFPNIIGIIQLWKQENI